MKIGRFLSNFLLLNFITFIYFYLSSLQFGFSPFLSSVVLWHFLNLEIIIVFLARTLVFARNRVLESLFWMYQLIFLAITPLSIAWDSQPNFLNLDVKYSDSYFTIFIISLCNLLIGGLTIRGSRKAHVVSDWKSVSILLQRTNTLRNIYLLLAPIIFGLVGYSYLFRKIRYSVSVNFGPIFYIAEALLYVLPIVIFLSYSVIFEITESKLAYKWRFVFGALMLALSNPVANARQISLLMLIPIVYPKLRKSTKISIFFCYSILLAALFFSNPFNRYTGKFDGFHFYPLSRLGDYDSYSQLAYAIKLGQEGLFIPLKQLLGSILFFVPRQVWPEKPLDSGVVIGIARQLRSTNLSCPWIAEAYINGGLFFVLIVAVLIAVLFLKLRVGNYVWGFVIEGFLSGVAFILLRGSLLQASGKTILGLIAALYLIRSNLENKKISNEL